MIEDCKRVAAVAAERGLQVCVNHSLLFDPQIVRALESVRTGKLGKVVSVDILRSSVYPPYEGGKLPPQFRDAGYPFRDLGIHELYLLEAFLGPIERIDAEWQSLGGEPNLAFDEWRAHVKCRDGMGQFQLSWNVKPIQHLLIIQGTKGVLRVDLMLMFLGMRSALPLPGPITRVVNAATDSIRPLIDVPRNVAGVLPQGSACSITACRISCARSTVRSPTGRPSPSRSPMPRRSSAGSKKSRAAPMPTASPASRSYPLSESVPYLVTGASGARRRRDRRAPARRGAVACGSSCAGRRSRFRRTSKSRSAISAMRSPSRAPSRARRS